MFISKRKVIEVLANEMASCDRYNIRALKIGFENLTDHEKEFYRMKHKIAFTLIDITLALGIYKEVIRKKNKKIEYWEKYEFDKELNTIGVVEDGIVDENKENN